MSGHHWDGSAWQRVGKLGMVDPFTGNVIEAKEVWTWSGSAWVRQYVKARVYSDDFNRTSGLGAGWNAAVMSNPNSVITGNAAHAGVMGTFTGRQAASWTQNVSSPLNRDSGYVKAQLKASTYSSANNNYTSIFLGGNDTFGSGVWPYLSVSVGSSSYIVTCNGLPNGAGNSATGGSNQTIRGTGVSVAATDLIELRRVKNFSTGIYTYTAYRNGSSFITWTDSAGICQVGSASRRWGYCIEGNVPITTRFSSPSIDYIEAGDL